MPCLLRKCQNFTLPFCCHHPSRRGHLHQSRQDFVGEEQQGGDHRQVLLLLAILTGYPGEASEILRQLIERVHNETWWEFIDSLNAAGGNWAELRVKLRSLRSLVADIEGCDVFRRYAASVARYSFQSGRVLIALQLPEAGNLDE
jgi:hypothetical protein